MRKNPEETSVYSREYARISARARRGGWTNEQRLAAVAELRKPKPEVKICTKCGKSEGEVKFYGKMAECSLCNTERSKRYAKEHAEEKREYTRTWRQEHAAEIAEKNRTWREANKEYIAERNKAWSEENKERKAAYHKEWREEHVEYRAQKQLEWQRANPDLTKAARSRRRAAKANAPINDFTADQWLELLEEYTYCCAYCFASGTKLEQDHTVPISKGGNNTKVNIVPACVPCNRSKRDNDLENWLGV